MPMAVIDEMYILRLKYSSFLQFMCSKFMLIDIARPSSLLCSLITVFIVENQVKETQTFEVKKLNV